MPRRMFGMRVAFDSVQRKGTCIKNAAKCSVACSASVETSTTLLEHSDLSIGIDGLQAFTSSKCGQRSVPA